MLFNLCTEVTIIIYTLYDVIKSVCESKVCLEPQQVLHSHFLRFFSSNLTGDVFKRLGRWSAILGIRKYPYKQKSNL